MLSDTTIENQQSSCHTLFHILRTPSPISSLAVGQSEHFFAGSDDGSLRVYCLSSLKVVRAIRGLGSEISSIVCLNRNEVDHDLGDIWLACGRRALSFQMDSPQIILSPADATTTIELGEHDEDVLNELALNNTKNQLAFTLDAGGVGVVDLPTRQVSRMKTKHESICGTIKFIPDRPSELVSGGYDSALLHFDFVQGNLLSRQDFASSPHVGGVSLSPPFILCSSISATGIIAAGTADGRVWLGFGGEKRSFLRSPPGNKKRSRKWGGLKEDESLFMTVAGGPIVALAFSDPRTLICSTLLGTITQLHLFREDVEGSFKLVPTWTKETKDISKVNTLVVHGTWLIIGGFGEDGKGVIEVWNQDIVPSLDAV